MDKPGISGEALQAYQAILDKNGMRRGEILRRMHMARCIMGAISRDKPAGAAYRDAVDIILASMPDEPSSELCRLVARDFFPFFDQDMRTIAALATSGAYQHNDIQVMLPEHRTLDDLVRVAPEIVLEQASEEALEEYAAALRTRTLDERSLENRMVIGRILLIGMRGLTWDGHNYRAVVDRLLPLFNREDTRLYFLVVAREFFSWINPVDPSGREGMQDLLQPPGA